MRNPSPECSAFSFWNQFKEKITWQDQMWTLWIYISTHMKLRRFSFESRGQMSNTVVRIAIPLNILYLLFLRELHRMVVTEVYGMGKSWNKKLQYHWIFSTSSFWEAVTWNVCNWGYHGTIIAIASI